MHEHAALESSWPTPVPDGCSSTDFTFIAIHAHGKTCQGQNALRDDHCQAFLSLRARSQPPTCMSSAQCTRSQAGLADTYTFTHAGKYSIDIITPWARQACPNYTHTHTHTHTHTYAVVPEHSHDLQQSHLPELLHSLPGHQPLVLPTLAMGDQRLRGM